MGRGVSKHEIEYAFDVPLGTDEAAFMAKVVQIARSVGWRPVRQERTQRGIVYYDAAPAFLFQENKTVRRVNGFTPPKFFYRYDAKMGEKRDRMEANHYEDTPLSLEAIANYACPILGIDGPLSDSVWADATHSKVYLRKAGLEVEVKYDQFLVQNRFPFNELEIEHIKPRVPNPKEERRVLDLVAAFGQRIGLEQVPEQKYTRAYLLARG